MDVERLGREGAELGTERGVTGEIDEFGDDGEPEDAENEVEDRACVAVLEDSVESIDSVEVEAALVLGVPPAGRWREAAHGPRTRRGRCVGVAWELPAVMALAGRLAAAWRA